MAGLGNVLSGAAKAMPALCIKAGKHPREEFMLPLAQVGEPIQPLQLHVYKAWMAHHQPAIRQSFEKTLEYQCIIGTGVEIVCARKGWIGA